MTRGRHGPFYAATLAAVTASVSAAAVPPLNVLILASNAFFATYIVTSARWALDAGPEVPRSCDTGRRRFRLLSVRNRNVRADVRHRSLVVKDTAQRARAQRRLLFLQHRPGGCGGQRSSYPEQLR